MGPPLQAPVFYPTKAEMAGAFDEYIESIEKKVADIGMCKIVAPKVSDKLPSTRV